MLSVKMHQTEATSWNQTKSGDDAAEKFVSNDAKKATTEATQLLQNVSGQSSKSSLIYMRKEGASSQRGVFPGAQRRKWEGHRRIDEFFSKIYQTGRNFARLQQDTRFLETAQLESRAAVEAKNAEAAKGELYLINAVINVAYLVTPFRRGGR